MLRDLYEKQASSAGGGGGGAQGKVDEMEHGFGRNMMEMREFVKAQRTYNVRSLSFFSSPHFPLRLYIP